MPEFIFIRQAEGSVHINTDFIFLNFYQSFVMILQKVIMLNYQALIGK